MKKHKTEYETQNDKIIEILEDLIPSDIDRITIIPGLGYTIKLEANPEKLYIILSSMLKYYWKTYWFGVNNTKVFIASPDLSDTFQLNINFRRKLKLMKHIKFLYTAIRYQRDMKILGLSYSVLKPEVKP